MGLYATYISTMSIRLCNNSNGSLKLNESLSHEGKYIMEGVFAELGVMNVNHRIYTENEYLKHLQYLRDDIRKGEIPSSLRSDYVHGNKHYHRLLGQQIFRRMQYLGYLGEGL